MSIKREIKGFWSLTGRPEDRCFGILTLEPNRSPRLEFFAEAMSSKEEVGTVRPAIHGQNEYGHPITLLFASTSDVHISSGPSGVTMIRPNFKGGYAILGLTLPDADSFLAHELVIKLQYLDGWLGISGFENNPKSSIDAMAIRYRRPKEQAYKANPNLEVGFRVIPSERNDISEKRITESACIFIRSSSGFTLKSCIEFTTAIRTMLHFAILEPVYPVQMTAFNDSHGRKVGNSFFHQEIEINSAILREAKTEPSFSPKWIFRYEDIRSKFAEWCQMWFQFTEKYDEALSCYAATVYHPLPVTMEHLSLTQALEAYHGIKYQSHDTLGFKAKIEALANLHATALRGLVDDIAAFAGEVKLTRDYYTHHNPEKLETGKVAERDKLFRMNEKLRLLFQMCVLKEIGITDDRFNCLRRQLAVKFVNYV